MKPMPHAALRRTHPASRHQRGAATLVVVMILFFIMAMMAAYANRNLIFEQRIASNYYRAGGAMEVADGGIEWALAMLNGGAVNAACDSDATTAQSFLQRYVAIDPQTRQLMPLNGDDRTVSTSGVRAVAGWEYQCPAAGAWAAPAIASSSTPQPSFGLYFKVGRRPGVIRIVSLGCTATDPTLCENTMQQQAAANAQLLGGASVMAEAALVSALKMPPSTPLTVGRDVGGAAGALGLHNSDSRGNGLLLAAGGTVGANALSEDRLESLPGTPGLQALVREDGTLAARRTASTFFSLFFGMTPAAYQAQPALRTVTCSGGDCSSSLQTAIQAGARMIWISGDVTLSSNLTHGSATQPVIIVVDGTLTINSPMTVNGLLYATGDISWTNASGQPAVLNGGAVAGRDFSASGVVDIVYRADIMSILSNATGSFVRVPGSWSDTQQ